MFISHLCFFELRVFLSQLNYLAFSNWLVRTCVICFFSPGLLLILQFVYDVFCYWLLIYVDFFLFFFNVVYSVSIFNYRFLRGPSHFQIIKLSIYIFFFLSCFSLGYLSLIHLEVILYEVEILTFKKFSRYTGCFTNTTC